MTCDYAACTRIATARAAGWLFCPGHLIEHHRILNGQELPDLPAVKELTPCGTRAALRRHYRLGQKPCLDCVEAERLDKMRLKEQRQASA